MLFQQTDQDAGEPVWDGTQTSWVKEEINLIDFIGQTIQLRFRLVSDNFVTGDGFYFDDFQVNTIGGGVGILEKEISVGQNMPNPATTYTYIPHTIKGNEAKLLVFDAYGKLIKSQDINAETKQTYLSTDGWASGIYYYQVMNSSHKSNTQRFVVVN